MLSYHELSTKINSLRIPAGAPLIVHASMSALGTVQGGVETVLGAIFSITDRIIFPAFTYKTMIIPEEGPEKNGIMYGSGKSTNQMAEFFTPDMPVDPTIGKVAEAFRNMPTTIRSTHPILSFSGVNLDAVIQAQSLSSPLEPINLLDDLDGWVLLIGVDHTSNTTIHLAEKLADRKQFTRWALTSSGVVECPGFPGCSDGFNKIAPVIQDISNHDQVGNARLEAVPIHFLVDIARTMMQTNPQALLCDRSDCLRCNAIRNDWGA